MKKLFFTISLIALTPILYAQEIITWKANMDWCWNTYYYRDVKELKKKFGESYADSINSVYQVGLSNYKKEEEHILKTKKIEIYRDIFRFNCRGWTKNNGKEIWRCKCHKCKNDIYRCNKKNGDIYIGKNFKIYSLPQKLEYLYLGDVPLPLSFDLNECKKTLKELTFSGCEYIRDTNFLSFDFSDFDSLQYLYFHILGYHMINGVAESLPPNACYLKLPPNLKSLFYYDDNRINTLKYPQTLEELAFLGCDSVPEQVFELSNLKKLLVHYYEGYYQPLSEKILTLDSLHTITLSTIKEKDVEILSKMPHLDTLILYRVLDYVSCKDIYTKIPDNLNELTNIRCIKVLGFRNSGCYPGYTTKIKKMLPNTTVLLIDGEYIKEY